jgi:hypothetical protein
LSTAGPRKPGLRPLVKIQPEQLVNFEAAPTLYSLLQTCQVNGIDGYRYLRELLTALPKASTADDYEALLPWRLTPRD